MNKKTFRAIAAILIACFLGIVFVFTAVLMLPSQFNHLYLGELADKYYRLRSFDDLGEDKIVIIGGSSVAFGINSQMIEESLGLPAVNFGLYGPLGTAIMMDLTRGHIHEGDIVVLAPETDHQTMSMYFNGTAMWDACDSDYTMLLKVRPHDWGEMLGSFWTYAVQKYQFYLYGRPQPDGVYDHDSFNEYGDIDFRRDQPVMNDWFDPEVLVDLDTSIVDQDYIDYVNKYIAYCERQGATVYFSWPPMNGLSVKQDLAGILEYATFVRENFNCRMISNITDYIMDAGYFYDTNYHLTDRGTVVHTSHLIQDLQNAMGDGSPVDIVLPPPPTPEGGWRSSGEPSQEPGAMPLPQGRNAANAHMLPALDTDGDLAGLTDGTETDGTVDTEAEPAPTPVPTPEAVGSSRDAACFTVEVFNEGLMITGVNDEGKAKDTLEVPWLIDGQKVVALGETAFQGCDNLRVIYIQSNISRIMQGAFDGAPRLSEIHIDNDSGANVLIPGVGLFDNVPNRARVYIPSDYYGTFIADYFWGNYLDRLEKE